MYGGVRRGFSGGFGYDGWAYFIPIHSNSRIIRVSIDYFTTEFVESIDTTSLGLPGFKVLHPVFPESPRHATRRRHH
jgi:hypothetical protein